MGHLRQGGSEDEHWSCRLDKAHALNSCRMRMEEMVKEGGIAGARTRHKGTEEVMLRLSPPCVLEDLRGRVPDMTTSGMGLTHQQL